MGKSTRIWVTLKDGRQIECQRSEGGMYREIPVSKLSETLPVGVVLRNKMCSDMYAVKTAAGWMYISEAVAEAATPWTVRNINDGHYEEVTL